MILIFHKGTGRSRGESSLKIATFNDLILLMLSRVFIGPGSLRPDLRHAPGEAQVS